MDSNKDTASASKEQSPAKESAPSPKKAATGPQIVVSVLNIGELPENTELNRQ